MFTCVVIILKPAGCPKMREGQVHNPIEENLLTCEKLVIFAKVWGGAVSKGPACATWSHMHGCVGNTGPIYT